MIEAAIILLNEARASRLLWGDGALRGAPARRSVRSAYILFCFFYCLAWGLVGGAVMYAIEQSAGTPRPYVDTLFTISSAASSTGLITLDTSTLQVGSNVVIAMTMLFCANTLLITAVPALFRICRAREARARCDAASSRLVRLVAEHAQRYGMSVEDARARVAAEGAVGMPGKASAFKLAAAVPDETSGSAGDQMPASTEGVAGPSAEVESRNPSADSAGDAVETLDVGVVVATAALPGRRSGSRRSSSAAPAPSASPLPSTVRADAAAPELAAYGAAAGPTAERAADARSGPGSLSLDKVEQGLQLAAEVTLRAAVRANDAHAAALRGLEDGVYLLGQWWIWWLAVGYYFVVMSACFLSLWAHFVLDDSAARVLVSPSNPATNGAHPAWVSAYLTIALFTNTGFSLLGDNLIQFGRDRMLIITSSVIATLGFSLYPMGLRIFALAAHAVCPAQWAGGRHKAVLRDILDNPRVYATHLFSPAGTWASASVALAMTLLLFIFFLVFNFPDPYFRTMFPAPDIRAMNGWFSAIMVYNAGFNAFDLSMMDVGSQVFMMLCMWLTGRPFAVGIITTAAESDVHDVAASAEADDARLDDNGKTTNTNATAGISSLAGLFASFRATVAALLQELFYSLRSDLLVLVICTLMICMYDNTIMTQGPFTGPNTVALGTGSYVGAFPVAFDLSSAYGNVGLSLGYPGTVISTVGALSPFSKLVVCFMCMHGYCMGIFPLAVAALELPPGIEDDEARGGAGGSDKARDELASLASVGAVEDPDVATLKAAGALLAELTPMQLLGICHAALTSPLAAARTSSTHALTPAQVRAGASVAALERRLTEDGKLALIALITGGRVGHVAHEQQGQPLQGQPPQGQSAPGQPQLPSQRKGEPAAASATPLGLFLGEQLLGPAAVTVAAGFAASPRRGTLIVRRRASIVAGSNGGDSSGDGTLGRNTYNTLQRRGEARQGVAILAGQRGRPGAAPAPRAGPRGT